MRNEATTTVALSGTACSIIEGAQDAKRLILSIRDGCAPADALLAGLRLVEAADDTARLQGFCRGLQKTLERGA